MGGPVRSHCRRHAPILLALHLCKHQEIGLCFKGAASRHPHHQRCAQTRTKDTLEKISTAHPRWSALMSTAQGNLQEALREQDGFCQLTKQRSTATRSKKPRAIAIRAWIRAAKFPKGWESTRTLAGNRLIHSFQLLVAKRGGICSKVFPFANKRENTGVHLT